MNKKLSTYAKENDISYKTAWRMAKAGKINTKILPTGTILVKESIELKDKNEAILYARVSSSENKSNLESQLDRLRNYASAKGYSVIKEVKEIGSGLNDKRQQLEKIFKQNNWDILKDSDNSDAEQTPSEQGPSEWPTPEHH